MRGRSHFVQYVSFCKQEGGEKRDFHPPTNYSDRCTVKAAISSSPDIQYKCQNAMETSRVWLVACQISCERGEKKKKKDQSIARINNRLLERARRDRDRVDEKRAKEAEGATCWIGVKCFRA